MSRQGFRQQYRNPHANVPRTGRFKTGKHEFSCHYLIEAEDYEPMETSFAEAMNTMESGFIWDAICEELQQTEDQKEWQEKVMEQAHPTPRTPGLKVSTAKEADSASSLSGSSTERKEQEVSGTFEINDKDRQVDPYLTANSVIGMKGTFSRLRMATRGTHRFVIPTEVGRQEENRCGEKHEERTVEFSMPSTPSRMLLRVRDGDTEWTRDGANLQGKNVL